MTPPLCGPCGTGGETAVGPQEAAAAAGGAVRSSGSTSSRPNKKRSKPATAGKGRWTMEEHADFLVGLERFGKDWQSISELVKTRTHVQTRTHHQKYEQQMRKGRPFPEEPYENNGDRPSTALTARPSSSSSSSSSPSSWSSSPSGAVRVPPAKPTATMSAATVVRGKRLTRPPASNRGGGRGVTGGGGGPLRSTRARAAAAARAADAARAAAAAAAADATATDADDRGTGGAPGGGYEGGRPGVKRLKIERPVSVESAASAFGQQVGVVTPPMGASPTPYPRNEGAFVKSLWCAVGGTDGTGSGADVAANGSGISIGGLCSRQLSPTLSEGFIMDGFLVENDVAQASLSACCSSSSSSSSVSLTSSGSSCSSPLPRGHDCGGDKDYGSLNRNKSSHGLGYLGGGVTTVPSAPMHDGQRVFQQQQQQFQRLRHFQQQQQQQHQRFLSAAAAATAAATASSMPHLCGGFPFFGGGGGGGQMDAFGPSSTGGGGGAMTGVGAFGCPEYTTMPAIAAAAHSSGLAGFGGPIDASSAALSLEPGAITIPGIGGVGLSGYNSGFGSMSCGSSSGSDGGHFAGTAPLPPGSESAAFTYRSGCGGAGAWRDTLELASDAGGLHEGEGVGLPSPVDTTANGGQQQHSQQKPDSVKPPIKQQQQQQMDDRSQQGRNVPAAVVVRAASPSPSLCSSGDVATSTAEDPADDGKRVEASPTPVDESDSDGGNPYDGLVIDVDGVGDGGDGDGLPLADNWMGLETIAGGGEFEAWQNKAGDEQFDFLAVFAFEDHFGML